MGARGARKRNKASAKRARPRSSSTGVAQVIRRFRRGFRWDGVELEPYKIAAHRGGEFRGASRQVLAGKHGEPIGFHVRYFELAPGGHTSFERHRHCHVVIGARGWGVARVGPRSYTLRRFDTLYVGPNRPHQLRAAGSLPFGFFCIVDAKRDRPSPV